MQAAATLGVALLVAANPACDAHSGHRARNLSDALRPGIRALVREPVLLSTAVSSGLAAFGWGLMLVGFPLYAVSTLHARPHASGYLGAAVAAGSRTRCAISTRRRLSRYG